MPKSPLRIDEQTLGWSSRDMRELALAYYDLSFTHSSLVTDGLFLTFRLEFECSLGSVTFEFPDVSDLTVSVDRDATVDQRDSTREVFHTDYHDDSQKWGVLIGFTTYMVQLAGDPVVMISD